MSKGEPTRAGDMSETQGAQHLYSQEQRTTPDLASPRVRRRRIVRLGWIVAGLVFMGGQFWALLKLFFSGNTPAHPGRDIVIGAAEQFAVGSVTHFWKEHFLLVHHPDGFLALSHDCTHSQCRVDFLPERGVIVCPCHGSQFSVTGTVLAGPAPRPLERYAVSLHAGQVVVHTAHRRRIEPSS